MAAMELLVLGDVEARLQMKSSRFPTNGDMRNEDRAYADTVHSDHRNTDRFCRMLCTCANLGHEASDCWSAVKEHGQRVQKKHRFVGDGGNGSHATSSERRKGYGKNVQNRVIDEGRDER